MMAISTRAISRSTYVPRPPLVQLDNRYPLPSARSPDSIRRSAPPARSASSAPPPLSAMGARSPSPPTSRSSGACASSPPRAPDAPRSASASPSNIASPTTPRSRGASLAISACARTSSTPGVTRPSSTSKCSTRAEPRDYAGFKPFGALVNERRSTPDRRCADRRRTALSSSRERRASRSNGGRRRTDRHSSSSADAVVVSQRAGVPVLLTADEVAAALRTTRKAVYAMIERGYLPGLVRVRRRVLVRQTSLLQWLKEKGAPSLREPER